MWTRLFLDLSLFSAHYLGTLKQPLLLKALHMCTYVAYMIAQFKFDREDKFPGISWKMFFRQRALKQNLTTEIFKHYGTQMRYEFVFIFNVHVVDLHSQN